jgi:ketosteroid isomerase-like protein
MLSLRILSLVLVSILIGAAAKADDRDDVLAANKAFGAAFSTLRVEAMDPLWAHDDGVTIIHPRSKTVLVGWDAVRKSWAEGSARNTEESVTMDNPVVSVTNNIGWVVGVEKVHSRRLSGEVVDSSVLTTNVYEKRDGRWLMVHHHGSRMPQ